MKLQVPPLRRVHPNFGSTMTIHSFLVNDVVVHPNQGELISCDQAGRIKQWDLSENTCTHELVSLPRYGSLHLNNHRTLSSYSQTPAGDIPMRSVSLASDSSCLVAGNNKVGASRDPSCCLYRVSKLRDGHFRVDAMSGRLMKRVQKRRASKPLPSSKLTTNTLPGCYSVQISSKTRRPPRPTCYSYPRLTLISRYLATCSADTTVKIWSVSTSFEFRLDKVLQGHQRWVWDCAFSADSAYLVTGAYRPSPSSV